MTGHHKYVYVTNHFGNMRDWPRCGNTFHSSAIFGSNKSTTDKLREGFEDGDVLVEYGNGNALKITQTRYIFGEKGLVRYETRPLTEKERGRHMQSLRHVERELRYQKGSYAWKATHE